MADAGDFVAGEVVHDDDVAGTEGWGQHLLEIGHEDLAGHGAGEDVGGGDPVRAETGDQGRGHPMAVRHGIDQPQSPRTASILAGHIGHCRRLVQEHKAIGIKGRLPPNEGLARFYDVRPALLGGVQAFF